MYDLKLFFKNRYEVVFFFEKFSTNFQNVKKMPKA